MAFILAEQRETDISAFVKYAQYLRENERRFPKSAYSLASSEWWFNFNDHRCPHDAWLESCTFTEPASGERREQRTLALTLRLFGAYHDGYIELVYPEVYAYRFSMPDTSLGHGDWRYDEFRVNDQGRLIHEIEWATSAAESSWVIEASDVQYRWQPST